MPLTPTAALSICQMKVSFDILHDISPVVVIKIFHKK